MTSLDTGVTTEIVNEYDVAPPQDAESDAAWCKIAHDAIVDRMNDRAEALIDAAKQVARAADEQRASVGDATEAVGDAEDRYHKYLSNALDLATELEGIRQDKTWIQVQWIKLRNGGNSQA